MPYLLIALLIALGVWQYRRYQSGLPALPGARPATPEQVVRAELPSALQSAILDLIYNGRDPQSMHDMASELEKYGFFDAAMLLHKRADELTVLQRQVDAILVARGLNPSAVSPALRETLLQEVIRTPVPSVPVPQPPTAPTAQDVAIRELRNEIGVLDTEYGALDRQIKVGPVSLQTGWNTALGSWRAFVLTFERIALARFSDPQFVRDLFSDVANFRQALATWRDNYARELGIQTAVPQTPPGPVAQAEIPAGTVPTLFSSRGTVVRSPVLNLRSNPDNTSAIVTSAPVGAAILVTSTSGDFYLVTYQGQSGWAPKSGVSIAANPRGTIPGAAGGILRGGT